MDPGIRKMVAGEKQMEDRKNRGRYDYYDALRMEDFRWQKEMTYRSGRCTGCCPGRFCDQLPEPRVAGHIASQLLRSGTSPAPNYAEARGAESDKGFVHKLKVVLKKLNESLAGLTVIEADSGFRGRTWRHFGKNARLFAELPRQVSRR